MLVRYWTRKGDLRTGLIEKARRLRHMCIENTVVLDFIHILNRSKKGHLKTDKW